VTYVLPVKNGKKKQRKKHSGDRRQKGKGKCKLKIRKQVCVMGTVEPQFECKDFWRFKLWAECDSE
jgi:hypothetical protein